MNLVRISGEFELAEFELANSKWLKNYGQNQGKLDWIWISWEFMLEIVPLLQKLYF